MPALMPSERRKPTPKKPKMIAACEAPATSASPAAEPKCRDRRAQAAEPASVFLHARRLSAASHGYTQDRRRAARGRESRGAKRETPEPCAGSGGWLVGAY